MRGLLGLLAILLVACSIVAQEVEFTVQAPRVVAVGEQFRLVYSLNSRPKTLTPPQLDPFAVLAGPSVSSSSNVQIVNGRVTQSQNYSYTYILEATTEGQFTIAPATASISGEEHQSNAITIEVVRGRAAATPQGRASQQQAQQAQQEPQEASADEVFVTIEVDRRAAYRGQPVLATIKLYTRHSISGFEDVKFPPFTGFWSQEVETPSRVAFERVNLDGRIYNMGIIRKYLLIPQRSGDITIDPFEVVVVYQQRSGRSQSIFDDFFGAYQTQRKRLASKPVNLSVKNLPPSPPASYNGAVGQFNFSATLNNSDVSTNEAVTLKLQVSGTGNLRLLQLPRVEFPGGFEVYDPKVSESIRTSTQGMTGSKTFEYVIIPRSPGAFNLDRIEFSYFDPAQERYITTKSPPLALNVEADGDYVPAQAVGFAREDVRFIGKDVRFIKTQNARVRRNGSFLYGSVAYGASVASILAAFIGLFVGISNKRRLEGDVVLVRNRKANKIARRRLLNSRKHLDTGDADGFYEELLRALWGYISDKLSIPLSKLSSDTARETLLERNVDPISIDELMRIINECEYARYAPKEQRSPMAGLYESALSLISKFEATIVKKKQ